MLVRLPQPESLIRVNVAGRRVPAVLGRAVWMGALCGGVVSIVWLSVAATVSSPAGRMAAAVLFVLASTYGAGAYDDYRGDEEARGFSGHIRAAISGKLTGGTVKLVAGALAGVVAGVLVADGWATIETALTVALSANFLNLTDRAPGRAGKVALVLAIPVIAFGPSSWTVAAAGLVGGLIACLPYDLSERAMLGDAGSNPLGGVVGLGIAVSVSGVASVVIVAVLAGLNLAAERWSFSQIIESTRWLRALDRVGRPPK
jgi:UDP-N-acetylmuramyl pentapeptide phosphotransferase/UDP-N-acetylglucosamine-1-phosphate transferase